MENKLNIWIIADDVGPLHFKKAFFSNSRNAQYAWAHANIRYFNHPLKVMMDIEGVPDIVIVDVGMITSSSVKEKEYLALTAFVRKHTSAIFCISSVFLSHAQRTIAELKTLLASEVALEILEGGMANTAKYITDKVMQYYPEVQ